MSEQEMTSTGPTQDDRIMAALSHITVILPFLGVVAPIIIWVTQKEKSQYVAFQALQALAYQLSLIIFYFVGMACYMCSFFGTFLGMVPLTATSPEEPNPVAVAGFMLTFFIPFAVFGLMFLGMIGYIIYGLVAAVMVVQGKDFRYVFIGNRLERYLQQEQ